MRGTSTHSDNQAFDRTNRNVGHEWAALSLYPEIQSVPEMSPLGHGYPANAAEIMVQQDFILSNKVEDLTSSKEIPERTFAGPEDVVLDYTLHYHH